MEGEEDSIEMMREAGEAGEAREAEEAAEEEDVEIIEFEQEMERRRVMAFKEMELQSAELLEIEELEERLEEWKKGCQGCRAAGRSGVEEGEGHSIWDCEREGADMIREGVERFKGVISWERFSCCFQCGIPQGLCNNFEANPDNGGWRRRKGGGCQFADVLIESVISNWVMQPNEFDTWLESQMRGERIEWMDMSDVKSVAKWMGKKIRWGSLESNKMCQMFCRYLRYRERAE